MEENEINYNEISKRMGYDILIGSNNGEEVRRANNLTSWKGDFEIYNPEQEPEPSTGNYLTFTAQSGEADILIAWGNTDGYYLADKPQDIDVNIEISKDGGKTWEPWEVKDQNAQDDDYIHLEEGESVMIRGNNSHLVSSEGKNIHFVFNGTSIYASGDITSLYNNVGGDVALEDGCFVHSFVNNTSLVTAPNLPSTKLAEGCYFGMFDGCTSLTTAPELPATQLVDSCYYEMFKGCTSLNYVKCLSTTTIQDNTELSCTNNWLENVPNSGTFIINESIRENYKQYFSGGSRGIPYGWTDETGFLYYGAE